jgi:hypothetical protein
MLDLPDGTVLLGQQLDSIYYQYTPSGSPLAAGKPTISSIIPQCPNFKITGTLFNGISEGAAYGDDWQMATNYPIVRLTQGTNVYYAKSYNWNRTGVVMTGNLLDTASFSVPATIPAGTYSAQVIVNGNPSASVLITLPCSSASIDELQSLNDFIRIYPNPASNTFTIEPNNTTKQTIQIFDVNGKLVLSQTINGKTNIDATILSEGVYNISVINNEGILNKRLVIVR